MMYENIKDLCNQLPALINELVDAKIDLPRQRPEESFARERVEVVQSRLRVVCAELGDKLQTATDPRNWSDR